jgi:hypothetical protein
VMVSPGFPINGGDPTLDSRVAQNGIYGSWNCNNVKIHIVRVEFNPR